MRSCEAPGAEGIVGPPLGPPGPKILQTTGLDLLSQASRDSRARRCSSFACGSSRPLPGDSCFMCAASVLQKRLFFHRTLLFFCPQVEGLAEA